MLTKLSGRWGEQVAAEYLKKKRYKVIGLNYSCRLGEVDIIATKDSYIVFAEVKLRRNADFAPARDFVTRGKQEKVIKTASLWLSQHPTPLQPRFDVIEVYAPEGAGSSNYTISHLEDAFQ
jgi:putative endonuclease